MIRAGQHAGLAGQVSRDEVNVVMVFIGGNDFIHALASRNPEELVDRVLKQAIANLDLATETILQASLNVQVFIATLPDIMELPEFATRLRAGTLSPAAAAACSNAMRDFNRHLRWQAVVRRRVSIVDLALATLLAPRPDPDSVLVAGRRLDRIHPANLPDHVFLADRRHASSRHAGELPPQRPESVRIGDWEYLVRYPLTALAIQYGTVYVLDRPITLEQPVYVPGNNHQGVWASPLLETVFGPEPRCPWADAGSQPDGISLKGDIELFILVFDELRRSYTELPVRWLSDLVLPRVQGILGPSSVSPTRASTKQEIVISRP